jgi:LuxR family maltose regulon positive regulatory protein
VPAALRRLGEHRVPPLLRPWLAGYTALALLRDGDPAAAQAALAEHASGEVTPSTAPGQLAAARIHLATGAYRPATRLLDAVCAGPSDVDTQVTAYLLGAVAAEALGREGAVRLAVAGALAAAGRERLVRPLLRLDPAAASLLSRHHDLLEQYPVLASRLDGASEPAAAPVPATAVTEREGVVLRYLSTMLTTDDIAAELCVSRNTVKSQIRSIYRKLGVARRRDAVHRARALHLL